MAPETDPLQAQFDGIRVPCYTRRHEAGDFVLERANRAAYERTEGRLQQLVGRRLGDIYPDRRDIASDLGKSLRERTTVRREMQHTLATTGERRRLDVSYVYVPPDRVMVHADDVTEQHESEERLRAVIATIESGLITVGPDGLVTDANPKACQILGVPRERMLREPGWSRTLGLRLEDGSPAIGVPDCVGGRALLGGEVWRSPRRR